MNGLTRTTIISIEVAQMVGKEHYDLLKDIRRYSTQLGEGKISVSDFLQNPLICQSKTRLCLALWLPRKAVSL